MERASQETWSKRVERWKDSGMTAVQFAAETGISPSSLTWWRWRLGSSARKGTRARASSSTKAKSAKIESRATSRASPLTFVEMTTLRSDSLEVILSTSVRVCVRPDFDAATLTRLLDVLEGRR
jgi:transposase